ncbi:MAG: CHRD domain-containing protein [Rhodospirillales bacterium]
MAKAGDTGPHAGSATLTDAQLKDLMAGMWYVNVHTQKNAPGEIRGQVMKAK